MADISFIGNEKMSERSLKRQMKNTKERWWLSFITQRGTYKPFAYEQDAEAIESYYRDRGYIAAQVGQPELEYDDVSEDGKTRLVRLRIPVSEGERYRVGTVAFDGQEVVLTSALERIFSKVEPGEYYSEKVIRDAFTVAREAYGSIGYYEQTGFPDTVARTEPQPDGLPTRIKGDPVVDITFRFQEGEQYFINRITFVGKQHHTRRGDPPGDRHGRARCLQHRGAQVQRPPAQSAGVFRAARGKRRRSRSRSGPVSTTKWI